MPEGKRIAAEGRNCWRREHSDRVAFLVDAQAYFSAFASAAEQAEHSIFILGWDIDSRLCLNPEVGTGPQADTLGNFLNSIVRKRKNLHVYILTWDFSMIYLFERELLPVFRLDWRTHSRIHFHLDRSHPPGASHHQKVVVIDDALAFSGGMDLTARRWDTPEHRLEDPRRIDPWGAPYHPFHDVQMLVDGNTAGALGHLARERWHRATGKRLERPGGSSRPWPASVAPDLSDVEVMISRTGAVGRGDHEAKEVAALFFDMITAAQSRMYIENQYLTASSIGTALGSRLQEKNGPEVVLIVARRCSGWLEQSTMGVYRTRLLRELHLSDSYGRLHVYSPAQPEMEIHSKVFIVDDEIVRVGSANLSNRSMGLDTECDLTIEAGGEARIRKAIAAFRSRLLGEHLGLSPETFAEAESKEKTLGAAMEKTRMITGKLEPFSEDETEKGGPLCDIVLCDPERPVDADKVMAYMLPEEIQEPARGRLMGTVALLAALGAIAAAWHWTPLKEWVQPDMLSAMLTPLRTNVLGPILILLTYGVLGLFVPITLLVISTVLAFDPLPGFLYSLGGSLTSASLSYGIGKVLGRDMIRRLAGSKLNRVSRHIIRHGFLAMTFLRLASVAPFTVINLIAGATHIRFKDYILGTIAGMTPGLIALTIFGDRMGAAIRHPDIRSLSILVIIIMIFMITSAWLTRRVAKPVESRVRVNR